MKNILTHRILPLIGIGIFIAIVIHFFIKYPTNEVLRITIIALIIIALIAPFFLLSFLKRLASTCVSLGVAGRFIPNIIISNTSLETNSVNLNIEQLSVIGQNVSTGLFVIAALCLILDSLHELGLVKVFGQRKIDEKINDIKNLIRQKNFYSNHGNISGFEGLERFNEFLSLPSPGLVLAQSSHQEGVNCILDNYSSLNDLFGEIEDLLASTSYKKNVTDRLNSIRQGLLFDTMKRMKPYLERHLEDYKDNEGNIMVLAGGEDANILTLSSFITRINRYK